MNRLLLFLPILVLFSLPSCKDRPKDNETFTIYLVRHAEKSTSIDHPEDPALTPCGQQRALELDHFLGKIKLNRIYSSDYVRTRSTASPTAISKGLEIEIYNPGELHDFSKLLLGRREDALIVGHSNTTPVLAGLLVGEEFEPMDETVYDRIYQVVISRSSGKLQLFQSALVCDD